MSPTTLPDTAIHVHPASMNPCQHEPVVEVYPGWCTPGWCIPVCPGLGIPVCPGLGIPVCPGSGPGPWSLGSSVEPGIIRGAWDHP